MAEMIHGWERRIRPVRLERRAEFSDYHSTRDFLDAVAGISEERGTYADTSFGRTYVNLTIQANDDGEFDAVQLELAQAIDALLAD